MVGTTDTPIDTPSLEPRALDEEVEFILSTAARYLTKDPQREDVLSVFAGLRPLVRSDETQNTAALSRDHSLLVSKSGLVTITGGKWTTYRRMGQDTVEQAVLVAGLEARACKTEALRIHGWLRHADSSDPLHVYGSDAILVQELADKKRRLREKLCDRLPYIKAEAVWAVREEMARTVEDVLARRTRALFLDARASLEMAPEVAKLMSAELKKGRKWRKQQVEAYTRLASGYFLT